jgi:DNA-binding transcriptional LysR family regulator
MDRLKAISIFVEIAERGSISSAAEALNVSRAMASRALAALEAWLGARLFHRTTRRLQLTSAGEAALVRFRGMLDLEEDLRSLLEGYGSATRGHVRLTCSPSLAQSILAEAVADFVRLHPGATVDLMGTDRPIDLVEERIDLAIRISNTLDGHLIARRLGVCRSVLCATPAYLARRGTPVVPEDLTGHDCLLHQFVSPGVWTLGKGEARIAVPVRGPICANEASVLLAAVEADAGIGLLPTYLVGPRLRSGALTEVLPVYPVEPMGIYGVYTSRRQAPGVVRALLDFLANRLGEDRTDPDPPSD